MGEGKVITINSKDEWSSVHQKAGDKAVRLQDVALARHVYTQKLKLQCLTCNCSRRLWLTSRLRGVGPAG